MMQGNPEIVEFQDLQGENADLWFKPTIHISTKTLLCTSDCLKSSSVIICIAELEPDATKMI